MIPFPSLASAHFWAASLPTCEVCFLALDPSLRHVYRGTFRKGSTSWDFRPWNGQEVAWVRGCMCNSLKSLESSSTLGDSNTNAGKEEAVTVASSPSSYSAQDAWAGVQPSERTI